MTLTVYLIFACLLLAAAWVVFRVFVRRDYRRLGRLSWPTSLLETLVFCLWGSFTWIDLPPDWPPSYVSPALRAIGWILVAVGLALTLISMGWLGFRRSFGQEANQLRQSGLYAKTRNPQILACALAVIGYATLWPSWHTLGWILLYAATAHIMVFTEEEHLRDLHGQAYERYCQRVPRYF